MTIPSNLLNPITPFRTMKGTNLLPPKPEDARPALRYASGWFQRSSAGTPPSGIPPLLSQDSDPAVLAAASPIFDVTTPGLAAARAYIKSDNVFATGMTKTPPQFLDLIFTSTPTESNAPGYVRIVLVVFSLGFGDGTKPIWGGPEIGSITAYENERVRIDLRREVVGDAFAILPLSASGQTLPGKTFEFAAACFAG